MLEFSFHCDAAGFLKVALLGRSHPSADDYWDGNWVRAAVDVQAGGFHGSVGGDLRAEELARFLEQLTGLQKSLQGTAEFETMEQWLSIRVVGDGRGHMATRCIIRDQPGIGNTLECMLATDQTFTQATVVELAAVVQAYPVVGKPQD